MCVCVLLKFVSRLCPQFDGTWMMSKKPNTMDDLATVLPFISTAINLFITAFEVHQQNHSDWPRTHRYSFYFCQSHRFFLFTLFLCSPLSIQTGFSLLPYCAVSSYRHPCSQHVFGPLLSSPDLTFTIPYLTYKHTDLSRLAEKFPPENKSNKIQPKKTLS